MKNDRNKKKRDYSPLLMIAYLLDVVSYVKSDGFVVIDPSLSTTSKKKEQ